MWAAFLQLPSHVIDVPIRFRTFRLLAHQRRVLGVTKCCYRWDDQSAPRIDCQNACLNSSFRIIKTAIDGRLVLSGITVTLEPHAWDDPFCAVPKVANISPLVRNRISVMFDSGSCTSPVLRFVRFSEYEGRVKAEFGRKSYDCLVER